MSDSVLKNTTNCPLLSGNGDPDGRSSVMPSRNWEGSLPKREYPDREKNRKKMLNIGLPFQKTPTYK